MRTAISLILFLFVSQSLPAQQDLLQKEIAKILKFESPVDFSIVPGILVGIIDGDSTYVCSYGEAMSKDSLYELGSVTKPIVAWLVEKALDSLGWTKDKTVCNFLPDSLCHGKFALLTIDQVLNHRSGLPSLQILPIESKDSGSGPYAAYNFESFADDFATMTAFPGNYSYSNIAYAMLHWLFDKVGGLESFAQHRHMKPLELNNTGWNFPDDMIAQGHNKGGLPVSPWHTNAMAPAIGLKSSIDDVLTFLRYVSPQYAESAPTLTPAFKKEINTLSKHDEYKVFDGWFLIQSGSSLVFYHTGRTGGHQVSVAFIPGSRKGVVVFSNGAAGSNDLCLRVLDMIGK
jgi:CubicO group peptidase (beta-lactamase class C family)